MTILSIDQSYTSCGIVVLDDNATIVHADKYKTDPDADTFARAYELVRYLDYIATLHRPQLIALEGLAFGMTGNATRDLAGLQYAIVMYFRFVRSYDVQIVAPNTVKKVATGSGKAKKEQLYDALPQDVKDLFSQMKLKKTTGLYDLTDAYWIGIASKVSNSVTPKK